MSTWEYNKYKDYTGETAAVTGDFGDRHKSSRIKENIWQQGAIGNIENFLSTVDWGTLGKEYDLSDYLKTGDISGLQDWKGTATGQLSTLEGGLGTAQSDIKFLQDQLANWDTTTSVGDVKGLDDILGGLKDKYASTGDVSDLQTSLTGTQKGLDMLIGDGAGSITDQITKATDALGINDYMKTSDFNTRMTENLDALGQTLSGQWGDDIAALDLEGVRQSIKDQGGDLSKLTTDFAGIDDQLDTLIGTGEGSIAQLIKSGGEDLKETITEGRGKDLANLELSIGKDRAADLLTTKEAIEEDRLSDIQAIAANLRQERGDDIFDLTETFQDKHDTLQKELGGDIKDLFGTTAGLTTGVEALTSGLGTTSQQLEALQTSFGDYKTDSATTLANVEKAFGKQVGDLGTDFTSKLSGLESSVASDILDLSQKTGDDISGLRAESAAGLKELGATVAEDRKQALSNLDTTWSGKLQAQDKRLQTQFDEGSAALNKRLSDISSSMNYRTLGDSAQGVKIRRSRAYNTGRTRSGTGQLGRSMKISTLNL